MPHEAETITAGRASSMRDASSWLANPPNTTECTAPRRHVQDDAVALADPEIPQHTGEKCGAVEQFAIGVGAGRSGDR